ncbi:predicted protein [Nematostella vectensis]|uniref:G-protein coupled receptors family 1 profile domain-containing protein n=1 Tax=Nematostella vectensis TaxID=45351 RepID=A7S4B2_NEMVE|nr:predicted protein [Nematostella vectensis]|eukprot:XP_001633551.1 predicted protein [Nematostella vectensis]
MSIDASRYSKMFLDASDNCTSLPAGDVCSSTLNVVFQSILGPSALTANIFLGAAAYLRWTRGRSPEKILIFNLVACSLVMVVVLPIHAFLVTKLGSFLLCDRSLWLLYRTREEIQLIANLATLATFVAIAYDRFEVLTKFPNQRRLTVRLACMHVVCAWCVSLLIILPLYNGPLRPHCVKKCLQGSDLALSCNGLAINHTSATIRIAVVTVYITVCCIGTSVSLLRATWEMRAHRQQIEVMYGIVRARTEVNFTKLVIAISLTYILTWTPTGVARIIVTLDLSLTRLCVDLWLVSWSFMSALLTPVIYIKMDKRILLVLRNRVCRYFRVAPLATRPSFSTDVK